MGPGNATSAAGAASLAARIRRDGLQSFPCAAAKRFDIHFELELRARAVLDKFGCWCSKTCPTRH